MPKFELKHIKRDIVTYPTRWIAGDIGGIRDKSVLLVFGRQIQDNKLAIIDEIVYPPNVEIVEIGRGISKLVHEHEISSYHIWIDAHGQSLVDLYNMCGISATLPPKQDRDGAIAALNAAFYRDDIFVSVDCVFTHKSLMNCMFNERRTDFLRTEEYGHADAIMAAVYGFRVANYIEQPRILTNNYSMLNQIGFRKEKSIYSEIGEKIKPNRVIWRG